MDFDQHPHLMPYSVNDLLNVLPPSVCEDDVVDYIKGKNLKINVNGQISPEAYQTALRFFQPEFQQIDLNGRETLHFESPDGKVKIWQNDVLAFMASLPSDSIDLIVTDPAYSGMNQRLQLGRGKIIGKYSEKGDGQKWFEEFHDTEKNYGAFLSECYRVLKPNRHIYIMFDSYSMLTLAPLLRNVFEVKNILVWDKQHIGLGHYFRRRHEFIVFASKGKRALNARNIPDVWRIKRVQNFKYPTQKPTEIFEMMLASSAAPDYLVCDPFVGSGAAAIASMKFGCRFVGCDIAKASIELASERITWYMEYKKDPLQPNSLVEDEQLLKILQHGQSL